MLPGHPPFQERLIRRFSALTALDAVDVAQLKDIAQRSIRLNAGRELPVQIQAAHSRLLVLDGWLARTKCLRDGRRQIIGFYVPADVVELDSRPDFPISTNVAAVNDAVLCPAPTSAGLMDAYGAAAVLDHAFLYRQVVRLGRMSAFERVKDWMLEIRDRLGRTGMGEPNVFGLPITQELLGDTLGLTAVHVNRTLKSLREAGVLTWRSGIVRFLEQDALSTEGPAAAARLGERGTADRAASRLLSI